MKVQSIFTWACAGIFLWSAITAFAAPGDLDPTFGNGGKLIDPAGYGSYDVAIQLDGKIVVAGLALGGTEGVLIAVARYSVDGSPDTTFGGTGRVLIDRYLIAVDIAIASDGKMVVAGRNPDGEAFGEIVRLNSNGSLDTSFGTNGVIGPLFVPSILGGQPDGKLLIYFFARLFRYDQNGSHDTSFTDGCKPVGYSSYHYPLHRTSGIVQADGKILTAFTKAELDGFEGIYIDFGVFRCDQNGMLDTTFGSGGIVITPIGSGRDDEDVAHAIALQVDGKIVVAGQNRTTSNPSNWELTLVRYNTNGSLDTGFGKDGIVTKPTGLTNFLPQQDAVAIQADGKILVSTTMQIGSERDFALVRFDPNGSLDTTFGGGDGVATVDFDHINENANGMALDGKGRAVVVGTSDGFGFALARFLLESAPALSVSGRVTTSTGLGLRNATVTMTDPVGNRRTATTGSFGLYSFDNITPGMTYTISVASRRYRFSPRIVQITTTLTNADFVGQE